MPQPAKLSVRSAVTRMLREKPIIAVVRSTDRGESEKQAEAFLDSDLALVEVTFTVPEATDLVRDLRSQREGSGPPFIGMGTVTTAERARSAVTAGADFIVTPNAAEEVADIAKESGLFLVIGALTPTEIVAANLLGADIVKVFPLPPVGGPDYLRVVRGPLGDIAMLASGGYGVEEIPAYRAAGATAFGIGTPLLAGDTAETRARIQRALEMAVASTSPQPAEPSRR